MKEDLYFEIKPARKFSLGLAELARSYELFYFFTWRDIKVKYKQTVLGFSWVILQPAFMTIIFTFTLGRFINHANTGLPYTVFVLSGLLVWNFFSGGLSTAAQSMVNNANIIKKIYFPRLIIPFSAILSALFDFILAFAVFIPVLIWYQIPVEPLRFAGAILASTVLAIFATAGPGCLLAALNVKYRDFRYLIPFMVQALLFVTPVIYPLHMVNNPIAKSILSFNPVAGAVHVFRSGITGEALDWNLLTLSTMTSVFLCFFGIYYFRKTEAYFADLA